MKKDAELHAEDDKKKKESAEVRNQAAQTIFELEKQIKEYGDKLEAADKTSLEEQ
ncbi:MAG: Hsp70 family protein, partial [bacterium]|nr:Hsp70 family protein [bacterium]